MKSHFQHDSEKALSSLLAGNGRQAVPAALERLAAFDLPLTSARSLLALLAARGETCYDLYAGWKSIRKAESIALPAVSNAVDTCGTGGDGGQTLNLSTLSALVMAAAGMRVLKHGNRAITSRCGSSDLLAAFGFQLTQTPASVVRSSLKCGMGYFHAPNIHPVYAHYQGLRKSLKIRTLFNLLGPVLNPAPVSIQILGVAKPELLEIYASLLPRLGRKAALIVHGAEGLDEITTLGISRGFFISASKTSKWQLEPAKLGFKKGKISDLQIHSISHAKAKAAEILKNKKAGAAYDSVILNAACGLWLSNPDESISNTLKKAQLAVQSGKAWKTLEQLVELSK